ncbi:LuxR C-terminal-related transcriptional regulator [Paraburkholderia sp. DHOC27]|uniref:LuxR C-terminal-related transcriptional regulator n=1 Tax=Paraburkholderia sp. DHOC27 TaxID=2303330 RepID=UPI00216AF513|nr:LuxR C-terminal-related transcriptional regulator [Paraburkholderia sp. DHOC27]
MRVSRALTEISTARLSMMMTRAWRALLCSDRGGARAPTEELAFSLGDLPFDERCQKRWEIAILQAGSMVLRDDCAGALPLVISAMRHCLDESLANIARTICRYAYWKLGDLEQSMSVGIATASVPPTHLQKIATVLDLSLVAAVEMDQLRFSSSRVLADDAINLCEAGEGLALSAATLSGAIIGQLLYEEGSIDEAYGWLSQRLAQIRNSGSIESAVRAYPTLAKIAASRGERDAARLLLEEAEALGWRHGWTRLVAASLDGQIALLVERRAIRAANILLARLAALDHANGSAPNRGGGWISRYVVSARARVGVVSRASVSDVSALRQLHHEAVCRHDLYLAVQVSVRLIDALLAIGEQQDAACMLLRTLNLGADVGLHQTFVDSGPRVGKLMRQIHRGDFPGNAEARELLPYLRRLLPRPRGVPGFHGVKATCRLKVRGGTLSERECTILILMSQGMSNKQIARRLCITAETVKSHAKKLFVKLAAKNRTEAVARATHQGLIQASGAKLE